MSGRGRVLKLSAAKLAEIRENVARAPRGVWLAARTAVASPYPCRCRDRCRPEWCPCFGRVDVHKGMPHACCARRAQRLARGYDATQATDEEA